MNHRFRSALVFTLCLSLAACGGSGSGTSASPGASADASPTVSQGTVTGFGSVIVDGDRISDTSATVETVGDGGLARAGKSADVKLGQRVEVDRAADGSARTIRVVPELIGVVSALDALNKTLTVNTNTVRTNADPTSGPVTTYGGYSAFGDIAVSDRVEVHGYPVVSGTGTLTIQATRIEQKAASTAALVTGTIGSLASGSFRLGSLTVSTGPSTVVRPTGAVLANGQRVSVLAAAGISAGAMTATEIRVRRASSDSTTIRSAGMIAGYVPASSTFTIGGLAVDASAASVVPASASLANDLYAVVTGTFDAGGNVLKATQVRVLRAVTQPPVELHGTITEFVDASRFKVRGVLVDATGATFKNGSSGSLANNVAVEIHGNVVNDVVKATTVEVQTLDSHDAVDLVATVQGYDPATRALTLTLRVGATLKLTLADPTTFLPAGKTAADLTAGTAVLVHGTRSGGDWNADTVTVLGQTSVGSAFLLGIAADLSPSTGTPTTFKIEGLTMNVGTATLPAGFAAGSRVIVQYGFAGGVYTATSVQLLTN